MPPDSEMVLCWYQESESHEPFAVILQVSHSKEWWNPIMARYMSHPPKSWMLIPIIPEEVE